MMTISFLVEMRVCMLNLPLVDSDCKKMVLGTMIVSVGEFVHLGTDWHSEHFAYSGKNDMTDVFVVLELGRILVVDLVLGRILIVVTGSFVLFVESDSD